MRKNAFLVLEKIFFDSKVLDGYLAELQKLKNYKKLRNYAALEKALPGQSLEDLHRAAVYQITRGLVKLGVLKGKVSDLVNEKKYFDFYMHRTGHWLGIDVHDISPISHEGKLIHSYKRPLEAGNLITIEPGLYFDEANKNIPKELKGIGIRIEDSVLITQSGPSVLTSAMPKSRTEIEELD